MNFINQLLRGTRVALPTLLLTASLCLPGAAAILQQVSVDTSALPVIQNDGFVAFSLVGEAGADSLTAMVSNFTSLPGGSLGGVVDQNGDVDDQLPATLQLANTLGPNFTLRSITFGNGFSFLLALTGPAVDSPSGSATAGARFSLSLFDGEGNSLTTDPDGFAVLSGVDANGTPSLTILDGTAVGVTVAAIPEPGPWTLCLSGLALLALARRR